MKNSLAITVTLVLFHQIHAAGLIDTLNENKATNFANSAQNGGWVNLGNVTVLAPTDGAKQNKVRGLSEHYRRQEVIPNIDAYFARGSVPSGGGSFAQTGDRGGLFFTANQTTADAKIFKKKPGSSTNNQPAKGNYTLEPWMPPPAPSSWVAELSSGFGKLTYIIKEGIQFDNGQIHLIDGLLTPAGTFIEGLNVAGFIQLSTVFDTKLPALRDTLNTARSLTFFGPSLYAAKISQSKLANLTDSEWETLLNYHTLDLTAGFIGYTPSLECGKVYKTKSGGKVLVTFKDGDTYINDAKIIGRDFILQNGVMQILDKVLDVQSPNATTLPGPDGTLVDISGPVVCKAPPPEQSENDAVVTRGSLLKSVILCLATLGFTTLL